MGHFLLLKCRGMISTFKGKMEVQGHNFSPGKIKNPRI